MTICAGRSLVMAMLACLLSVAGLGSAVQAQVETLVKVRVTAVSGTSVFLDRGRIAGLEPGDTVRLLPRGRPAVEAVVKSVSRSNSRADLVANAQGLVVGTLGELRVPSSRLAAATADPLQPRRKVLVQHPPWTRPLGKEGADIPLLAPIKSRTPQQRPITWRQRTWWNTTNTWNRGLVDQRYLYANLGSDLSVSNLFGHAGELQLRGDLSHRRVYLDFAEDTRSNRARLDRLSYKFGHAEAAPGRYQVGRFLQTMFPELGLVDGVEADLALQRHHRVGFSAGASPEPFTDESAGDNLQSSLFWRYVTGEHADLDLGVAYQKTWHRGAPDRDLVVANVYTRPWQDLVLYASLWLDYYTSGEAIKDAGFEVSEFMFNGAYRLSRHHGVGFNASYLRWPELKRDRITLVDPTTILRRRVTRLAANTWHQLAKNWRVRTDGTWWEDSDNHGWSGEVGLRADDWLYQHGSIELRLFQTEAVLDRGYGMRCSGSYYSGGLSLQVGYQYARYRDIDLLSTGIADRNDQALTGSLQTQLTNSMDLSLNVDYRFGSTQDAVTIGLYVQTRSRGSLR